MILDWQWVPPSPLRVLNNYCDVPPEPAPTSRRGMRCNLLGYTIAKGTTAGTEPTYVVQVLV
jgi:hypothetical protein